MIKEFFSFFIFSFFNFQVKKLSTWKVFLTHNSNLKCHLYYIFDFILFVWCFLFNIWVFYSFFTLDTIWTIASMRGGKLRIFYSIYCNAIYHLESDMKLQSIINEFNLFQWQFTSPNNKSDFNTICTIKSSNGIFPF